MSERRRDAEGAHGELTEWLRRSAAGDREAEEIFYRLTLDRVRAASAAIRRGANPAHIGTGTLAQEGLLRLARLELGKFTDSTHFFRVASKVLRRTFVDLVRHSARGKRDREREVPLEGCVSASATPESISGSLILKEALEALEALHPELYEIYLLHWVYGQRLPEAAEFLGVSERTARRRWQTARHLLALQLSETPS